MIKSSILSILPWMYYGLDRHNDFFCYTKRMMAIYPIYVMSSEWSFFQYFPQYTSTLTEFLWNLQNPLKNGRRNLLISPEHFLKFDEKRVGTLFSFHSSPITFAFRRLFFTLNCSGFTYELEDNNCSLSLLLDEYMKYYMFINKRKSSALGDYRINAKAAHHHFYRYSDVRSKGLYPNRKQIFSLVVTLRCHITFHPLINFSIFSSPRTFLGPPVY